MDDTPPLRLVQTSQSQGVAAEICVEMIRGYGAMLLASGRSQEAVAKVLRELRNVINWLEAYPWEWTTTGIDEWGAWMRTEGKALSTVRNRQGLVRRFCDYMASPEYEWVERCRAEFGVAPRQVCFEWNTTRHIEDMEGRPERRAFTKDELQRLFDTMDDRIERIQTTGNKGFAVAWRDATMNKLQYAAGLRAGELVKLQTCDLNPHSVAPQFGRYAVVLVRWGKRSRGGPYRRRGVQMTMDWAVEALRLYVEDIRPVFPDGPWLFPSERRDRKGKQQPISVRSYEMSFAERRREAGLAEEMTPHCLRHTYQTHMAEMGRDPVWRQRQAGHRFLSSTSIYTHPTTDQMNRELSRAISDLTKKPGGMP